jgi:hypothetical protein
VSDLPLICNLTSIASRPDYGRTRPVRVFGETLDGTEIEAYLKAPYLGERLFPCLLEREWFAGRIASILKLPCAAPLQIQLTPEVVASEPDAMLRTRLQTGPKVLFGSLNGGAGWIEWSDSMSVTRDNLQLAAEIYLFDTLIENWDRCAPNPNILVKGEQFLMIDHGEAFVSATGSDAERDHHALPWRLGGVKNCVGEFEIHPFWSKLHPKKHVDFAAAADRWKALPADTFGTIATEMPDCWSSLTASRIVAYMTDAVENIDAVVANIENNFER